MSLKDRFIDYWTTDFAYEDYKYDITILEQLVYGFVGTVGCIVAVLGLLFTFPSWILPYMIYKAHKCKKDEKKSENYNDFDNI